MRLAVFSDVHGNLASLKAVLADIQRMNVDTTICLGDLIDFGPDHEEVIKLVTKHKIPAVRGNHEDFVSTLGDVVWTGKPGPRSKMKRKGATPMMMDFVNKMPLSLVQHDLFFIHGCPPDSIDTYIYNLTAEERAEVFELMEQRIAFVGHTHQLILFSYGTDSNNPKGTNSDIINSNDSNSGGINSDDSNSDSINSDSINSDSINPGSINPDAIINRKQYLMGDKIVLDKKQKHIISVGSVGMPRDSDERAKYVVYDTQSGVLEPRLVGYVV